MKKEKCCNRREFIKVTGIAAVGTTAGLYGCSQRKEKTDHLGDVPSDKMTYTKFQSLEDKISLLGYGCMRWQTMQNPDGQGEIVNQEVVNELIDYALEHGINFFDTAPGYVMGQ